LRTRDFEIAQHILQIVLMTNSAIITLAIIDYRNSYAKTVSFKWYGATESSYII